MNYKKFNDIAGWIIFAIATVVYYLGVEPTASWWDCGEFILSTDEQSGLNCKMC